MDGWTPWNKHENHIAFQCISPRYFNSCPIYSTESRIKTTYVENSHHVPGISATALAQKAPEQPPHAHLTQKLWDVCWLASCYFRPRLAGSLEPWSLVGYHQLRARVVGKQTFVRVTLMCVIKIEAGASFKFESTVWILVINCGIGLEKVSNLRPAVHPLEQNQAKKTWSMAEHLPLF